MKFVPFMAEDFLSYSIRSELKLMRTPSAWSILKTGCAESAFLNPGPDLILEWQKLQDHDFEILDLCIVLHTCRTRAGFRHFSSL